MLKDNEILELIDRYQRESDQGAFEKLYKQFMPLIKKLAYKQLPANYKEEYEDAIQVSSLAFAYAVKNYDINRNVKFLTFVYTCIFNEMAHYLRDNLTLIKYPAKMKLLDKCNLKTTSLDKYKKHDHEHEKESFLEKVEDEQNLEDEVTWRVALESVLSDNEKELAYRKYALGQTQQQIASEMGISQTLINRKLKRMRERMKVIFNG